jgi:hypothetical protein
LRDDLDDRRRRIGIGLDVERGEGRVAEPEEGRERDQHQRPPRQAERDQATQHRAAGASIIAARLVVDEDRAAADDLLAGREAIEPARGPRCSIPSFTLRR